MLSSKFIDQHIADDQLEMLLSHGAGLDERLYALSLARKSCAHEERANLKTIAIKMLNTFHQLNSLNIAAEALKKSDAFEARKEQEADEKAHADQVLEKALFG